MATTYSLKFAEDVFPFQEEVEIYRNSKKNSNTSQFFVFLDEKLYSYKFENFKWHKNILINDTYKQKILLFPKTLGNEDDIMMIKTTKGIEFYQYRDDKFNFLLRSNDFVVDTWGDIYGWAEPGSFIKCGYFYDDKSLIGILAKNRADGLQFHGVFKDSLMSGEYPIQKLDLNTTELFGDTSDSNFFLEDLKSKGQEDIIVRSRNGMEVYEFDQNNDLQRMLKIPDSSKISGAEEKLFFPNLTGQSQKDIVLFNTSGLFVYQYNKNQNYNFIHYNPLFDKQKGWDEKYINTVRFTDINFDGREEMFFTGPRGTDILTFDNYTLQWRSVLDISRNAVSERHSNLLEIGPIDSVDRGSAIIFTQDENKLRWAKIEREEIEEIVDFDDEWPKNPPNITSEVIPEFIKLHIEDDDKPHILLRDQLDFSTIIKGVDKDTGKASFELPLIGLPNFANNQKMRLYYNGNDKEAGIVGTGWSFPNCVIIMDHQGSILPENTRYFFLLEDFPLLLILDSERSTDSVEFFKITEESLKSEVEILYYKNEERWEVDYKDVKQIYGRRKNSNEDAVSLDLSWEFWRESGSSPLGQVELPTAWFLSEIRGGQTSGTYYEYDIINVSVPESNKKFTREVYLKSVGDLEGNKIIFNYSDKLPEEYYLPPLRDENGIYNAKKVQTRYLTDYSLTTYNYRQEIRFNYKVESGKRFLTEIVQNYDPTNRPVLQFSYKNLMDSSELERVVLPTGAEVEFTYETMQGTLKKNALEDIPLICDVLAAYKVDYGPGFVLISYLNKQNHVVLRMYNKELTTEMYSSLSQSTSTRFPFLGQNSVIYYDMTILDDTLVFTLGYGRSTAVCILHKEEDKWLLTPKYFNYGKDAVIKIGDDFVAVLDTTEHFLEVIVWDMESKDWIKEKIENLRIANSTDLLLQISGRAFLIYDNETVTVGYRDKDKWHSKVILKFAGLIDSIKETLHRFDLKSETYDTLLNLMKNNIFQVNQNFILVSKWIIEGTESFSDVELFTLNNNYEVVHQENHKISQDDLSEYSKEITVKSEDDRISYIRLAYKKDGERLKIILKSFRGALMSQIETFCKNHSSIKDCLEKTKKEAEKEIVKETRQLFIIEMQKYLTYLQLPIVTCGSKNLIYTGNNWKLNTPTLKELEEEWSVSIDDQFLLAKQNSESSIKLFDSRYGIQEKKLIHDLQIKNITHISNKYPIYLAYQKESEEVNLLFYEWLHNENVNKAFALPRGETISLRSDHTTLVTHAESTSQNGNVFLNLRPFLGIKSKLPNPVVKKLTVSFDNEYKRYTGYDYHQSSVKAVGDIVFYEKTVTIPGNNRSSFGYVEELANITGNYGVTYNVYDASGKLIKLKQAAPLNSSKNITEENETLKNSTLLDVSRGLEVAQFYPYKMEDEEVSYYGFEDYEINKMGTANSTNHNRWSFNETHIVKQEFSLTGENYLHLSESRLLGVFQPRNQNQHYVASCWIRTNGKNLQIGQIAPYLKAVVYTEDNREINGYFSEIKFQYDDWSYLEVVIDLIYSKEVFKNLLSSSNSSVEERNSKAIVIDRSVMNDSAEQSRNSIAKVKPFKIIVTVSPGINSTIDVDHIRFSPLKCNFKAAVYNSKTRKIKEIINANGLIKRHIYNDYEDQIVSINENGEIEKISTSTKASSIGRIFKSKSTIEVEPTRGFYEDFSPYAFKKRWNVDNNARWKIAPGVLYHTSNQFDQLKLRNMLNFNSYGVRLYFTLQSRLSIIDFNEVLHLERSGDNAFIRYSNIIKPIPHIGEILIVAENNRLMVWIDGGLYFDEGGLNTSLFDLNIYGNTKISDMLIFNDVSIQVNYFNGLDERVQEINLETSNDVIVTEYLYDELGRQCILTKPTRLQRSKEESLLVYYPNFVTNDNPLSHNSVWKINRIEGEFESLDHYSYYQVTYNDNPLDEKSRIGLPGQEFSISGAFGKRFSSNTKSSFINQNYPSDRNYTYFVEHKFGNIEDVKVFNEKNNTVAWLISVPGRNDVLATYEYNADEKLIRTLSPLYHEKAGTIKNSYPHISQEHNSLSVETSYDKMGNVIAETSPDSGKIEYLYNDIGLRKFAVNYSSNNSTFIQNVVYFIYDQLGRLTNVGKLISPPEKEKLLNLTLTENNTEKYQVFYYSDFEREPTMRRRLRRTITYNDGVPFIEESAFSKDKKIVSKRIIVPNENSDEPLTITTKKRYELGKVREIEYPINIQGKPFKITYSYDKLGRMKAIGVPSKRNLFVEFAHNSVGHVTTEYHLPGQINFNFTRNYSYNSASFLTKLQDKFLTEDVYYTEGSYGGNGYTDGIIARTVFNATWHEFADSSKIHLNEKLFKSSDTAPEESKFCFDKLKEAGYINQYNHQAKIYYPSLDFYFPIVCRKTFNDHFIRNVLGKNGFPSIYGHLYDYGPYQELIRAKYFVGDDIPAPLHPSTFAERIPKINATTSQDIWNILSKNTYLLSTKVLNKPHGKRGIAFIQSRLCEDLKSINQSYEQYCPQLQKILPFLFSRKLDLPLFKEKLKHAFVKWTQRIKDAEENIEKVAKEIIEMLEKKGYLKNPLDQNFNKVFQQYHSIIPDIIKVLIEYFGKQLNEAEFDVEVHNIDENGNHKHYYTGFDRYELEYHENSNQIKVLSLNSSTSSKLKGNFVMKHDSRGNVVHATHNGIKNITYHAVSNRATTIELEDGRKLIFNYDAQGERVLKRVLDASGAVKKEVHYVRDEFGRTLVERELTWSLPNLPPGVLVTAFIYGPEGLIGFIRRNEYYSVIPDHEGSIRLVVKDGEVVAAYDYLPYGNLMRQYGANSEAHISYRYTGQEWDEETGLYNYHARLYDPIIGRFYQLDPKKQYFSPYKYAGNSPVSMIDPNGEIAFFILAILGVIGAYFGGAAAGGSWNPLKWDYSDWTVWLGVVLGGLGGALAPEALIESVAVFEAAGVSHAWAIRIVVFLSAVGAYFGMAGANNEWNPLEWDLTSPDTWNGLISGLLAFGTVASTYNESKLLLASLSSIYTKVLFVSAALAIGGFFIGMSLVSRKIDFTKPGVYFDILSGFIGGFDLPLSVKGIYDKYGKKNWLSGSVTLTEGIELLEFPLVRSEIGNPFEVLGNTALQDGKLADEWLALSSTYDSLENQMNAYLSFRTFSSLLNKNQSITNGIESKNKAINKVKNIAKEIVDVYKKIIETYGFSKETYTENMQDRLEAGKIPNAVMTIAKTIDSMAFVAFSSETGPGFLSSFSKKEEDYLYSGYPPEKPQIPRIIAINDEEKINNLIEHALEDKRNIMVEINYKTYTSEKHELKSFLDEIILLSSSPKLKSYFNNAEVENLIEKIGDEIKTNGYIQSKERTAVIILSFLLRKQNLLKKTAAFAKDLEEINPNQINKLLELEEKIVDLEQSIGLSGHEIDRDQSFEEKKKMLISELKTLREMKFQLYSDIVDLNEELRKDVNIIWKKYLKKYLNEFTHWSPTIFIEPQLVSLLMRDRLDFPPQLGVKYTLDDLQYLPAEESIFRRYISEFEPIVRCLDCRETERNVTKILIDPEWESAIATERSKWLGKQNAEGNCSNRSNVFQPYNQIVSENMCHKAIKGDADSFRKKRFAIEEKQLTTNEADSSKDTISENDENNSNHVEGKISDDNRNSKPSNFTNNLFGWMRTSMNKLFDSKKILPEKASNSRIAKGIADSNSSLSAVTATVDVNSTLLLLDAVVRKVTGQKYMSAADDNGALLESRGYSLDIGLAFEKTMKYAASKSGISMHRFNIHYIDVQDKVIDKIMSGKLDEIAEILISHAESACPHRDTGCPGMLSPKKFEKFIDLFSKRIDVELNDLLEKNKRIKVM